MFILMEDCGQDSANVSNYKANIHRAKGIDYWTTANYCDHCRGYLPIILFKGKRGYKRDFAEARLNLIWFGLKTIRSNRSKY